MKSKFLLCISIALLSLSNAQNNKEADSILRLARANFGEGNYKKAGELYDLHISRFEAKSVILYNASCAWSLSNDKEKALNYLRSAFSYGYYNIEHATKDPDLAPIRNEKGFNSIIAEEREFQSDSIITLKDVVNALLKKNVAVFKNKRFKLENKIWYDAEKKVINKIIAELNDDRITLFDDKIDFSNKKLVIQNPKGQVYIEGLKLKSFVIQNTNKLKKINSVPNGNVIELMDLDLGTLTFYVRDWYDFRMWRVKASETKANAMLNLDRASISDSDLTIYTTFYNSNLHTPAYSMGSLEEPVGSLMINNTVIRAHDSIPSLILLDINTNNFYFSDNTIEDELTFYTSSFNKFFMSKNEFKRGVDFTNTILPSSNFYVKFDQFKSGLGVLDSNRDWEIAKNKLLMTGEDGEIEDVEAYDKLIYSYRQFFDNFRKRGDIQSANASYSQLKEIMLRKDRLIYENDKTFQNFMNYRLNWLLKILSDNGTSPAKTIVISTLIILLFSFIYVFFPSDWDRKSKQKIIRDYKLLREKNEHGILKPLGLLISDLISTWFNAIMLSLNAFVTLGFGAIPTRGVARYLCIIQGFVGWFLLSIFTVALVNQVLI